MKKLILAIACVLALGWFVKQRLSEPSDLAPNVETTPRAGVAPTVTASPPVAPAAPSAHAVPSSAVSGRLAPVGEPSPRSAPQGMIAGPISLFEVLQPNNRYFDAAYGVALTFPSGWSVRDAARWGVNNGENTVFFDPPAGSAAIPSMYYRTYADGPPFDMTNPEATLRDMARQKEESRTGGGQSDYKNDPESFVFRTVDGHPSLSYFATFTNGGQVHAEYFLRILGDTGYVMFFTRGPAKDVQAVIPAVFEMGGTVKPP